MAKNFSQFTSETTPELTDQAVGYRTAVSGGERRTAWSAVYALFKTSFDSVYAAAEDLISHTGNTSNPHSVTKAQVGLTNVDDTSDAAKPVSTATQTALDLKAATADVLEKTNVTSFTPTTDYHPATKQYVDANSGGVPEAIEVNGQVTWSNGLHGGFIKTIGSLGQTLPNTLMDGFTVTLLNANGNRFRTEINEGTSTLIDEYDNILTPSRYVEYGQVVKLIYNATDDVWTVTTITDGAYNSMLTFPGGTFEFQRYGRGMLHRWDTYLEAKTLNLTLATRPNNGLYFFLHNDGDYNIIIDDGDTTLRDNTHSVVPTITLVPGMTIRMDADSTSTWLMSIVHQATVSGSGDVVGPASAVDSRLAAFDGTTGKLIKDGGQTVANVLARANHTGTQPASSISDFDTEVDNNPAVTANTAKTSFPEAPSDGSQYARKDAAWEVVAGDAGTDAEAIHDNVAGEIAAVTLKSTPVSGDLILIEDSAASNAKKSISLGSLPPPTAQELDGRPIYNALTDPDSTVVADYVSEASQGTDVKAAVSDWIAAGILAGKKRFRLPAGKYHMGYGANVALDGDDLEVFGDGLNQTIIYAPGWTELQDKRIFFNWGNWGSTKRLKFHGIDFRVGWHSGQGFDDDSVRGWYIKPLTWEADMPVEDGQALVSTDGLWISRYHGPGYTALTEPTWAAGSTTENGVSSTVSAIQTRAVSTAYGAASFIRHVDGELVYTPLGGTTSATANPNVPQYSAIEGGGTYQIKCLTFSTYASDWEAYECSFRGVIGFNDAGGSGISCSTGTTSSEKATGYGLGRVHGEIHHCEFKNFSWGSSIVANVNALEIHHCHFYQTGGWMTRTGGFNCHNLYGQCGSTNIHSNVFDRHMGGTQTKIHINVLNRDGVGHTIRGNEYRDWDWVAINPLGGVAITSHPDFVYDAGVMSESFRGMTIVGNTFRQTKSVVEKYNLGGFSAVYHASARSGVVVTGNVFFDCIAFQASSPTSKLYFGQTYSDVLLNANYFGATWRVPATLSLSGVAENNYFEFAGMARGATSLITLRDHARFTNNVICVTGNADVDSDPIINIGGSDVTVEGNKVWVEPGATDLFILLGGDHSNCVLRGNQVYGDCRFIYMNRSGAKNWLIEGNRLISHATHQTPYLRGLRGGNGAGSSGWSFKNNTGDFWELADVHTIRTGEQIAIDTSVRQFNVGKLVDRDGASVTAAASIVGVDLRDDGFSTGGSYYVIVGISENAEHWIDTSAAVTLNDWVKLSSTAGKVDPNGTTGSTTKPTSGFIGIVRDVGTAGAGAGRALIEALKWNAVSGGGDLSTTDIDTLSELNAIVTDATLIDTGDSRLSDARTPVVTGAHEWSQTQSYGESTLTDGANISWNAQTDPAAKVTLADNRTLDNPTNLVAGATYILRVIQDATGSRTLAYGTVFKWPGGTAPTLSTAANAVDVLTFYCDGTNLYGTDILAFA